MINENNITTFVDTLVVGMNKDDFLKLAYEQLTEEDEKMFGINFKEQMLSVMLYFSIFAPYPATFDSNAIAGIIDEVGSSNLGKTHNPILDLEYTDTIVNRTLYIIERATQLGIIEINETGRFYIKQETIDKLLPILDQFED